MSALAPLPLLLAGLLLAIAGGVWFTIVRLRRPPRRTYASAVARGLPGDPSELDDPRAFEAFTFRADDPEAGALGALDLTAWDIEGDDPEGPVVICTPGWGDSKIGALLRLEPLAGRASRLYAWDPPGQGDSPGRSFLGTREHLAIDALRRRARERGDATRGVVLAGWSLGGGASIVAAARWARQGEPPLAVVAEAPYRLPKTPARNVMRLAGYPWLLNGPPAFVILGLRFGLGAAWLGFDRAEHAADLHAPLLVLHGETDPVVPLEDGRAIAQRAPDGRLALIEGAGHNDLWTDPRFAPRCAYEIDRFLNDALASGSADEATTGAGRLGQG